MSQRDFFEKEHCDRCYGDLTVRTTSWFNQETICASCTAWEEAIISARPEAKMELEAIGYIPNVDFDVEWGEDVPAELAD